MKIIKTDISEIKVEFDDEGNHRLIDSSRNIKTTWVSYGGISVLEMPKNMKSKTTGRGQWIWTTKYWDGVFETETLLEVF